MNRLNLPAFDYRCRTRDGREEIFDPVRRKYVALTPEEWVRQHFINFLITEKATPLPLIAVEQMIVYNTMQRRCDIIVYSRKGTPRLIVECKASSIEINQKAFEQIARYKLVLKVPYLVVTNGLTHICCKISFEQSNYVFLKEIPSFDQLTL